jgi:serine/threonine protein kinase
LGSLLDGRYLISERIGFGGMGIVYRARQCQPNVSIERDVAIKVLTEEASTDEALVARFRNETRIISELHHPNTLRLFDFGHTSDGRPYFVTELLHGTSLDTVLEEGALEPDQTVHVLRQIAESLAEAHAKGIVHRDLKPANVFIEKVEGQEVVKVLDFGIARSGQGMMEADAQTNPGKAFGTPAYMSPEQARGETVDARSDLYSLGVIAYECLCGRRPFEAETTLALLVKHLHEEPMRLSEQAASPLLPLELDALVMKLLEKEPARRPQTAVDVRKALSKLELVLTKVLSNGSLPTFGILNVPRSAKRDPPPPTITREERAGSVRALPSPIVEISRMKDCAIVKISGVLNENLAMTALADALESSVVLDLDGVLGITSAGIREWLNALERLRATELLFIRCRPELILQFNMIQDFARGGKIVSLYLPYTCAECDEEINILADLRRDYEIVASGPSKKAKCSNCGGDAEFDEDEYFSFLRTQPMPFVSEHIGLLIDRELGPLVSQEFTGPTTVSDHPMRELPTDSPRVEHDASEHDPWMDTSPNVELDRPLVAVEIPASSLGVPFEMQPTRPDSFEMTATVGESFEMPATVWDAPLSRPSIRPLLIKVVIGAVIATLIGVVIGVIAAALWWPDVPA